MLLFCHYEQHIFFVITIIVSVIIPIFRSYSTSPFWFSLVLLFENRIVTMVTLKILSVMIMIIIVIIIYHHYNQYHSRNHNHYPYHLIHPNIITTVRGSTISYYHYHHHNHHHYYYRYNIATNYVVLTPDLGNNAT